MCRGKNFKLVLDVAIINLLKNRYLIEVIEAVRKYLVYVRKAFLMEPQTNYGTHEIFICQIHVSDD